MDKKEEWDEEEVEESLWKRVFVIGGGVLMILLMISYIFVSFPMDKIIAGWSESDVLINNVVDVGEFLLIFENGVEKDLQELYFDEQKKEFSVCLKGDLTNGNYHIDSLYVPTMFEQTYNHVSFEPCDKDTIMMLHTHPYKSCVASATDMNTLRKMQSVNPEVVMVVMCESERFSVYR